MKRLFNLIFVLSLLAIVPCKSQTKETKKIVKQLQKDGWKSLKEQDIIDQFVTLEILRTERTSPSDPKYIFANATAKRKTLEEAKRMAIGLAKDDIQTQLKTHALSTTDLMSDTDSSMQTYSTTSSEGKLINLINVVSVYRCVSGSYEVKCIFALDVTQQKK